MLDGSSFKKQLWLSRCSFLTLHLLEIKSHCSHIQVHTKADIYERAQTCFFHACDGALEETLFFASEVHRIVNGAVWAETLEGWWNHGAEDSEYTETHGILQSGQQSNREVSAPRRKKKGRAQECVRACRVVRRAAKK